MLHAALLTAASCAHGHLLALYRLLALAIPSRHGLRGVTSHHFALALPRLSRHGLHGVASHHFAATIASYHFAATIVVVAMDNGDMTTSMLAEALH